jgi:hypothetical protein
MPEKTSEFKTKLNKYGFIHVPKYVVTSLPFELEKPLTAKIDSDQLTIMVTTKTSAKNS